MPVSALSEWLLKKDVITSEEELSQFILAFHSTRYTSGGGGSGVNMNVALTYRDYLEFIVLPSKKEKLREKVLKRSGLNQGKKIKKPKKPDEVLSTSGISGVSKETDNSVERRKEEEAAKISVDFAMA